MKKYILPGLGTPLPATSACTQQNEIHQNRRAQGNETHRDPQLIFIEA